MPNPATADADTDNSLLSPIQRRLALSLSDALWRLRTNPHDAGDITLTIPLPRSKASRRSSSRSPRVICGSRPRVPGS